ncbi:MAG: hypothetical protein ACLPTM_02345 [Steroidobacteraceae bacterium]
MRKLVRGLIATLLLAALPLVSQAGVFVSVTLAPPALPVYVQPALPGPGYVWTPGYWAWDGSYYWVPGTWVMAPVGLLWTPGYWGWSGGVYAWNAGYWGPHVGFYGGVNYGFGYGGVGFAGGEWRGGRLYYNRSVTNVSTTNVTNVYNRTVVNNTTVTHTSFNGGPGGIQARPTAAEIAASHEQHTPPTHAQSQHQTMAAHDNTLRASVNGGHPAMAATSRPGEFSGKGVAAAHKGAGGGIRTAARTTETHGGAYPQTHANGFAPPHGAAGQPRGSQPQPQHTPPRPSEPRANESRGTPRGQQPQKEQRDEHPQHQARSQQARPERMAMRAPQAARPEHVTRPQQTHAQQARPQQQRMVRAPQPHSQERQARGDAGAEHRHG